MVGVRDGASCIVLSYTQQTGDAVTPRREVVIFNKTALFYRSFALLNTPERESASNRNFQGRQIFSGEVVWQVRDIDHITVKSCVS